MALSHEADMLTNPASTDVVTRSASDAAASAHGA